jgi:hypothetical protein
MSTTNMLIAFSPLIILSIGYVIMVGVFAYNLYKRGEH